MNSYVLLLITIIGYSLSVIFEKKTLQIIREGKIKSPDDIRRALHTYPMKVPDPNNIKVKKGVMEVTDSPTGCMLIKREVIEKMIKAYPDTEIVQKTVINGELMNRPYLYNLFCQVFHLFVLVQ